MEKYVLNVQRRSVVGRKVRELRKRGLIPAVVYGAGEPTIALQLERRELDHLIAHGGVTQLVSLVGDGLPETQVLIRELQRHPVRRSILHVDFVRVRKGATLETSVPVVPVGEAPVASKGGLVLQNADTLEIRCLAEKLPSHIEVDLSSLVHFNDTILARDIALPEGVTLAPGVADEVLFSVSVPRGITEAGEEEAVEAAGEPEVISKGKEAAEAEEEEERAAAEE